jgi:hypothetical protein
VEDKSLVNFIIKHDVVINYSSLSFKPTEDVLEDEKHVVVQREGLFFSFNSPTAGGELWPAGPGEVKTRKIPSSRPHTTQKKEGSATAVN